MYLFVNDTDGFKNIILKYRIPSNNILPLIMSAPLIFDKKIPLIMSAPKTALLLVSVTKPKTALL